MQPNTDLTLGYWKIRGLAGILRNLLAYCEIPFQNHFYTNPDDWFGKDKEQLGFEFPNLPYLLDGNKKITESKAIMYYIPIRGNRRDLIGDDDDKFIKVQVALGAIGDLKTLLNQLSWTKGDFETEKNETFSEGKIKTQLTHFNKLLENKEWLCDFLSLADFLLFEAVEHVHDLDPKLLEAYPNLSTFYKRFSEIPQIKAHRQSDKFVKLWFTPGLATWTNDK